MTTFSSSSDSRVVLASASPRRRQLLQQLGIEPVICVTDIDETVQPGEGADVYVSRLAEQKAMAGTHMFDADDWVIGADTTIAVDDAIIGKPQNFEDACRIWEQMAGRWHQVCTAVAVCHQNACHVRLNRNRVWMDPMSECQMRTYWESGEPQDKAGGYAIQGQAAAIIRQIEGSYSGIMGLPLYETRQLLLASGYTMAL